MTGVLQNVAKDPHSRERREAGRDFHPGQTATGIPGMAIGSGNTGEGLSRI
jgi:hypothetical protein